MTRARDRYAAVHERLRAGESLRAIGRALPLSRPTMRRFARAAKLPGGATGKESKLDPFKPYICQRRNGIAPCLCLLARRRLRPSRLAVLRA